MISGNRRKLLCLQRRIGVSALERGQYDCQRRQSEPAEAQPCRVHEEENEGDSYLRSYQDLSPTWCTCCSWMFSSCCIPESQMLQMDISEGCPTLRLHPLPFILAVFMILLE